jgi:hypothetical protein
MKALPAVFPAPVLARAVSRPFVPPMPRLAIDGYWRAHPLRADRLARALAARLELAYRRDGRARSAAELPCPAGTVSRGGIRARQRALLRLRAEGLPLRLA